MNTVFLNYGVVGILAFTCIKLFLELNGERKALLTDLEESRNKYLESLTSLIGSLKNIDERLDCIEKKLD